MHNEFTYILEAPTDEDPWYIAYCVEVPEASGQGTTAQEAIASLQSAIRMILELRREKGLQGVPADARKGVVTVDEAA